MGKRGSGFTLPVSDAASSLGREGCLGFLWLIDKPGVGPFGAAQNAPTLYRVWMPVKERLAQGDKPQRAQ